MIIRLSGPPPLPTPPPSYTALESLSVTFRKFYKLLYCTCCSSVFIADFKQMAYIVQVPLLLTLGMLHTSNGFIAHFKQV